MACGMSRLRLRCRGLVSDDLGANHELVIVGFYGLHWKARRWRKGIWHWVFHSHIIPSFGLGSKGSFIACELSVVANADRNSMSLRLSLLFPWSLRFFLDAFRTVSMQSTLVMTDLAIQVNTQLKLWMFCTEVCDRRIPHRSMDPGGAKRSQIQKPRLAEHPDPQNFHLQKFPFLVDRVARSGQTCGCRR